MNYYEIQRFIARVEGWVDSKYGADSFSEKYVHLNTFFDCICKEFQYTVSHQTAAAAKFTLIKSLRFMGMLYTEKKGSGVSILNDLKSIRRHSTLARKYKEDHPLPDTDRVKRLKSIFYFALLRPL